jgi:hypothetical protein
MNRLHEVADGNSLSNCILIVPIKSNRNLTNQNWNGFWQSATLFCHSAKINRSNVLRLTTTIWQQYQNNNIIGEQPRAGYVPNNADSVQSTI